QAHHLKLEDKRDQIRQVFLYHELDLPRREEVGQMTAYEVARRLEKAYQLLGPTMARIEDEWLSPMLLRVLNLLIREGVTEEVPQSVREKAGESVLEVRYLGPLARAQRMDRVDAIERWVSQVLAVAEAKPEALDLVDWDEAFRLTARRQGVPEELIQDDDTVAKIRQARAQAMQEMQQDDARAVPQRVA
ncbi:MAG: hypothetical protein GVY18_15700, partial [Bacteroidetes bacterium]|nr:hypothetical protein [Bacteroidota bacterium]